MASAGALPAEFNRCDVIAVHQGDCHVSDNPALTYSTVLGSCISACVRDVAVNVGGMNHFLLPTHSSGNKERFGASARYGAYAMEQLINTVLSKGTGRKSNLEIKVFGGGNINSAINDVGAKNIEFVREFLAAEGYAIDGEDLGGAFARRVMFKPHSGRAFVKRLDSAVGSQIAREELAIADTKIIVPAPDDIELF